MTNWIENHPANAPALVSAAEGLTLSYGRLREEVSSAAAMLSGIDSKALALLDCDNRAGALVSYLACLNADIPLIMGEPRAISNLAETYTPEILILREESETPVGYTFRDELAFGFVVCVREASPADVMPHPDLALMLNTSGSTGSARLVRLTAENLESNARSIAEYLRLRPDDRSIQSLPLHYSYGLSLVNSHFVAGGCTVLTEHSFMRPEFWDVYDSENCTSFAGVPYMYEVMHRLRHNPAAHSSTRYFTQAGGPLKQGLISAYLESARAAGKDFFVMYGQTEATARISYVPPDQLSDKTGSIGVAIPGGKLELEAIDEDPSLQQLCYSGPNVMLGYAESRADLVRGDDHQGILRTGDLATVDDDGFYFLTGRLNRFAKVFGKRINLVDVEHEAERRFNLPAAAVEGKGKIRVFAEGAVLDELAEIRSAIASFLEITPTAVSVESLSELPLTASGKKNYKALQS